LDIMATATQKSSPVPPSPSRSSDPALGPVRAALVAAYRFFASLKLAVVSILTLALVLAYGTFYESWHGTAAVQERIYQGVGFALLLAVLAINIFCAASIRYPWKKRQTGFVITHVGLLIVLLGSFISKQWAEEGQVGYVEGEERDVVMVQPEKAILRLRKLDNKTFKPDPDAEYAVPFRPGVFPWGPGRSEVVSREGDPFKLVVKDFLPASSLEYVHEAAEGGVPMARLTVMAQPPGSPRPFDIFANDPKDPYGRRRWFLAENEFGRVGRDVGPARIVFQYAESPDLLDDFLHPPKDAAHAKLARLHYRDSEGKERVYEWPVAGQEGKSVLLPGSDLTATFVKADVFPDPNRSVGRDTGDADFPVARFKVRKGEQGPEVEHVGFSTLPGMARFIAEHMPDASKPLVRIGYFTPPLEGHAGTFGVIELMGTPGGTIYQRVFGREGLRVPPGPLELGKDVRAFGGGNMPMSIAFRVDKFLPSGRERVTCVPADLPPNKVDTGIKAALLELTVDGKAKEFWVRRTGEIDADYSRDGEGPVFFKQGAYQVAYDVARKPLGFQMKLVDFQSDTDPGSRERSSYVSNVRVTDAKLGVEDRDVTISMNSPMTHRGYTFYQSNFEPLEDANKQPTGQFRSVFAVHYDPAWQVIYSGCLLVVIGAFVQFYMRSGIFVYLKPGTSSRPRPAAADEPL